MVTQTRTQAQAAVGWSDDGDLKNAVLEAAVLAQARLGGTPDAAVVISAGEVDDALPRVARSVFGPVPIAGCHAEGIVTPEGVERRGVGVLAVRADGLDIHTVASSMHEENPWLASVRAARLLLAGRQNQRRFPKGLALLFGDLSLAEEWGPIVRGWRGFIGSRLKTAGLVTDGPVYVGAAAYPKGLAVLLLDGTIPVGVGVGQGWAPMEEGFTVTKHEGRRILELNGEPAESAYLDALEHAMRGSGAGPLFSNHPLGIPGFDGHWLIRRVDAVAHGGLVMFAEVPAGSVVHLMAARPDGLIDAAREAAAMAVQRLAGRRPMAGLIVMSGSCWERARDLAPAALGIIREAIGCATPFIGSLSEAEIGSLTGSQPSLHTESIVVVLLGDP